MIALVAGSIYAFTVLVVFDVVPRGNCVESDKGINFLKAGNIMGNFSAGGQSYNGTFFDTCLSNTSIIELVCGGSINARYDHLGAALLEDCGVFNKTCVQLPWDAGCQ